jgi:3-methylfumaryl-CoA hydratase
MTEDNFQDWIGRTETAEEKVTQRVVSAFNATFDRDPPPAGAPAPLGIHWCLASATVKASALGQDGHPARGNFFPHVPLPRRMWAGGALILHDELLVGDKITRHSKIAAVTMKHGRTGALCFVAVDHEYFSPRGLAIAERQDIVYRPAQNPAAAGPPPVPQQTEAAPAWRRDMRTDPVTLFRYSALTFNGHRIHYDLPYATQVESYPGLVVHGPLQATLLLAFAADCAARRPQNFTFRGLTPLTDPDPFTLNARPVEGGLELWVETGTGRRTMQALAGF